MLGPSGLQVGLFAAGRGLDLKVDNVGAVGSGARGVKVLNSISISHWARAVLAVAFMAGLSACADQPSFQPGYAVTTPAPGNGQEGFTSSPVFENYVIRPNDVISVDVFREADLSLSQVPVSASGHVSLPLVGTVNVAGRTAGEVEDELERALGARYLRDPDVSVNVLSYASHQVTVEGSVERAGVFTFLPGTRLSGGVAYAEGLSRTADSSEIAIIRQTAQGLQIAKFDYLAVQTGAMIDPVLQPGDRVIVGTDGLSVFWQDLLKALPAFAIFTNI